MQIEIITPEKMLFKGEADLAELPGEKGKFQVLESHAPLMSMLTKGDVSVSKNGSKLKTFSISSGYVEVKDNTVIVLVNEAV